MVAEMDAPIPLVTLTLTTDELAMISAGLIELRKFWAKRYLHVFGGRMDLVRELNESSESGAMIQRITEFKQRLEDSVSEEQGNALLQELLKEQGNESGI